MEKKRRLGQPEKDNQRVWSLRRKFHVKKRNSIFVRTKKGSYIVRSWKKSDDSDTLKKTIKEFGAFGENFMLKKVTVYL